MKWITSVVLTLLLLACSKSSYLPDGSFDLEFNSVAWKSDSSFSDVSQNEFVTSRQKMLGDLLENVIPGKNKAEISALLGPSLETPYGDQSRDFIYYMGPQRDSLFGVDSEWLLIWLNHNGQFERFELYTD